MTDHKPFRSFEYEVVAKDRQRFWWHAHGQPVFEKDGTFLGYRGTTREITAEKATADRLRLSERMQALGKLTAGVAHDFNNILAVVQGYAELLAKETSVIAREDAIREIVAAAKRGASLMSQFLSFGRVQRMEPEPIEMGAFLSRFETLLNRTLGESFFGQRHTTLSPPLCPVRPAPIGRRLLEHCIERARRKCGGRAALD